MDTFSALRSGQFRLLWAGVLATFISVWMSQLAVGWLIVELAAAEGMPERASFYIGLAGLLGAVPGIAATLLGGVIADRMDKRRVLIGVQLAGASAGTLFALLVLLDRATLPVVIIFMATLVVSFAFEIPTRQAMVPELVPPHHLMSAIGLMGAVTFGSMFVGPLIGGVLIAPIGIGGVILVTAGLRLVAVGFLLPMRPSPVVRHAARAGVLTSLRDGLSYARGAPVIYTLLLVNAAAMLGRNYFQLLPAYASQGLHVGATELSWLLAASGAGQLGAMLVAASLGRMRQQGLVLLATMFVGGALLGLVALRPSLEASIVLLAFVSFALGVNFVQTLTTFQREAPPAYRGRVISLGLTSAQSLGPIGLFILGSIGSVAGIENALAIGGVTMAVVALAGVLLATPLREYRIGPRETVGPIGAGASPAGGAD